MTKVIVYLHCYDCKLEKVWELSANPKTLSSCMTTVQAHGKHNAFSATMNVNNLDKYLDLALQVKPELDVFTHTLDTLKNGSNVIDVEQEKVQEAEPVEVESGENDEQS